MTTGAPYQRDWIAAMYNRWPVRSLIHVRRSRLRMATHCEGMTSKFVWNCEAIVSWRESSKYCTSLRTVVKPNDRSDSVR
jgi:hypothetical protein